MLEGDYTYRRVFHDDRLMTLCADGRIGAGSADCEQRWNLRGRTLEISGEQGVICRLRQDAEGIWRGRWTQFERMPIELAPATIELGTMPRAEVTTPFPGEAGFWWLNFQQLTEATKRLCRQLPKVRAVAGIPRAGVFVAALIAQCLNVPLIDIDDALVATPFVPPHRRSTGDADHPILIVDDTVASGRLINWYRARATRAGGRYLFAAPYVHHRCRHLVDCAAEEHPYCANAFEWNLLHEITNTSRALTDMDGVLCHDWSGTDEEADPGGYQQHLQYAKPLRCATAPLLGIVTGRMHIYRQATEDWLGRQGIEYSELHMLPASTEAERQRIGHAEFKAEVFKQSSALIFIESDSQQAKRIHELTGKPVIDFSQMRAYGTV